MVVSYESGRPVTITGPFSFTAHWKRSATVDLQLEGGLWHERDAGHQLHGHQ